ncbi:MAG: HAD-IIA family hydrolase [Oscillospiraceae bacterium]
MENLAKTKVFLLDMDGTFYLGEKLLPGALRFLKECKENGKSFCFLTNNSSKSAEDYIKKLEKMGAYITQKEILTSADATLIYLEKQAIGKNILLIGTKSLETQFEAEGYEINAESPCAVVLGFDTSINYKKLTALCDAVRAGLPYIATHPDFNCPTESGFIPDIGAVIAFVKASTGKEPDVIIGKPNAYIANAAATRFACRVDELCMVGDRLYTDIALMSSGCAAALVLSGETDMEALEKSDLKPNIVCANLSELADIVF